MSRASRRPAPGARLSPVLCDISGRPARLWQLALAALAGNMAVHQLPVLPPDELALVAGAVALGLLARAGLVLGALPAIAVLMACWTTAQSGRVLAERWPAAADGQDAAFSGWIDTPPREEPGRTVLSMRVTGAQNAAVPARVRLSWYDAPQGLRAGQALSVVARLRSPRGLVNPGGFDYERWLLVERYGATGYIRRGQPETSPDGGLARWWLGIRAGLVERIARLAAEPDGGALITALGLGERGAFEDRHWSVLQRTGTSHLVAVSGLHIGLIAAMAYALILRLALRAPNRVAGLAHRYAALGCIVPAAAYAALAGFALPTQRALIMVVVAQVMVLTLKRWSVLTGLGLALLLILLHDPLASLTASFWLSFGAVAVLLAVAGVPRASATGTAGRWLAGMLAFGRLQWLLMLGLAPLTIWFFGQLSLASLAVNLLAIPLFGLVAVPLSLLSVALLLVSADGFGLPTVTAQLLMPLWRGLELAAASPLAAFDVARPTLAVFLLAVTAVVLALPYSGLPGRRLALTGLVPLAWPTGPDLAAGEARLTVLDVGHGLAVLIETVSHRVLFDAGPVYRSGFDVGAEVVVPAVAALGAGPVDLLLLSHGDADHAGGAAALVSRYPGAEILAGPDVVLAGAGTCRDGQRWVRDGVRFSVLHPPVRGFDTGNESSCVLRVEAAAASALVTGDIEARAEARLDERALVAADVVVVPHHGSLTSSSQPFVDAVGARIAVASAAFNSRWDFPRPEVRRRWEERGAVFLATGQDGAVSVVLGRDQISYEAARDSRRRYWRASRDRVSGAIAPSAL